MQAKPGAIVAGTFTSIAAAKRATTSIPTVMTEISDPVAFGFIASLARPGGNITGSTNMNADLSGKLLELLEALVPRLRRVVVVRNPSNAANLTQWREVASAARVLRIAAVAVDIRSADEIDAALKTISHMRADAIFVLPDGVTLSNAARVVRLVAAQRLPAIYENDAYIAAGGLMAYGVSETADWSQAATYVAPILKGAKTADLPVERPTTFDLIVDLKTRRYPRYHGTAIHPAASNAGDQVRRRDLITLLGGAPIAWPCIAKAQQPAGIRKIGVLSPSAANERLWQTNFAAFRQGLAALGWSEGQNVQFESRYAGGDLQRFESLATELVKSAPDVILAVSSSAVTALKQRTHSIPIVFVGVVDPVMQGYVSSLSQPGANLTGFSMYDTGVEAKMLQLLREIRRVPPEPALSITLQLPWLGVPFVPSRLRPNQLGSTRLNCLFGA